VRRQAGRRRARRLLFRVVFRAVSVHLPFEMLFSVWVLEAQSRKVRWIRKPAPGDWKFESNEPIGALCPTITDAMPPGLRHSPNVTESCLRRLALITAVRASLGYPPTRNARLSGATSFLAFRLLAGTARP
jgi:hypothetical protein